MTKHRSAASLIASGIASITIDQRLKVPRVLTTDEAFEHDRRAIRGDARRVMRKLELEPTGL